MVREQTFLGYDSENPYHHLREFVQLCSCLSIAGMLLTTINLHSSCQLLGNNTSFTLRSIHILFISNEFHKFWMSFDFRNKCAKNGQNWAKTQAGRPLLGRPAWHSHKHHHVFDPEAMWHEYNALSRGLGLGLIRWTKRHWHESKDPQVSPNSSVHQ